MVIQVPWFGNDLWNRKASHQVEWGLCSSFCLLSYRLNPLPESLVSFLTNNLLPSFTYNLMFSLKGSPPHYMNSRIPKQADPHGLHSPQLMVWSNWKQVLSHSRGETEQRVKILIPENPIEQNSSNASGLVNSATALKCPRVETIQSSSKGKHRCCKDTYFS